MKIDKNSTIKEILDHEKGEEVMAKYRVPCLSCPMAAMEIGELKIKEVAEKYGLDLEGLISDLNSSD